MNTRSALYKNEGKDAATMRKNRTEHALTLRKAKREETMIKRRNIQQESERSSQEDVKPDSVSLEEVVVNVKSTDSSIRLQAAIQIRKMLSSTRNPPIDKLINSGILPVLVDGLKSDDVAFRFESAWALTNIASGNSEQTRAVVEAGAVPLFLQLLCSNNVKICEQAIWALGNIIGDGTQFRDLCIELGIVESLVKFVRPDVPVDFLRNVSWVLVNLVRRKESAVPLYVYEQVLPLLAQFLHCEDKAILIDTVWAFCYICDTGIQQIQMVINHGVVNKLVSFLAHEKFEILSAAIRSVGNIATGTDSQTDALLDYNVLNYLQPLLSHPNCNTAKEAVWALSNITAGSDDQIQAVFNTGLLPKVIDLMCHGDYQVQYEAVWAVTNVSCSGTPSQMLNVVEHGALKPLCDFIDVGDSCIIKIILGGLFNILKYLPDYYTEISEAIEECGGLEKIEKLQEHENEDVYKLAHKLIAEFFTEAEDGDIEEHQEFKFDKSQEPSGLYFF